MKNLGLLFLGILLGALAMYFYCCNEQEELESGPPTVAVKGIISPAQAKVLDEAYNIKYAVINDSLFKDSKTGDNRSSCWSIEDIQNYINHAENQAGELGYTLDGLRVYLGAYPSTKEETGLTTLFFIPTGTKIKGQGGMIPSIQGGSGDIKGADGLNMGSNGIPPSANYPQ
jgi:hypothetical protein